MDLKCDLSAAEDIMSARWERHAALESRIAEAIRQAVKDQSKDEQKWGGLPFTEAEARPAIACAVAPLVGKPTYPDAAWWAAHRDLTEEDLLLQHDEGAIEKFIDEPRIAIDPKRHFELYE